MKEAAWFRRLPGVVFACAFAAVCLPAFSQPKVEVVPQATVVAPTVSAIGEAVTRIHPDIAILTFAVEIRNPNTTQAVDVNQRMTKKVVAAIEATGVSSSGIAVGTYRMKHVVNTFLPALGTNQPVEFHVEQHGTYEVTSDISVKLHDIAGVSKVINSALLAGVDRIDRVKYEVSNLSQIESGLLPQAIKDAKRKAELLARVSGLSVGEPLRVVELPDTSSSTTLVNGNTVSGQTAPPRLLVRLRVRVVYAAKKASS